MPRERHRAAIRWCTSSVVLRPLCQVLVCQPQTRFSGVCSLPWLCFQTDTVLQVLSAIPTSAKLTAAQAKLQAYESHLAVKEREVAARRSGAVKESLGVRCRAVVECGWAWGEIGREALKVLDTMGSDGSVGELQFLFYFVFTFLG